MASLKEELVQLTQVTPVFNDPEDIFKDECDGKLSEITSGDHFEADGLVSLLRRDNQSFLEEGDKKYSGRQTTRKHLHLDFDEHTSEDEHEDDDIDDKTDSGGNDEAESDRDTDNDLDDSEDVEEDITTDTRLTHSQSQNDMSDKEETVTDSEMEDSEELSKTEVKTFSSVPIQNEAEKAMATRCQLKIWDHLIENRIKLQKAVVTVNRLPPPSVWNVFVETDNEFSSSAAGCQKALITLTESLMKLQGLLASQYEETVDMFDNCQDIDTGTSDDNNDKIDQMAEALGSENPSRKRKHVHTLEKNLVKRHKQFNDFQNRTIQKWYNKTQLASGRINSKSFSSFDQSTVKQIEQILGDKERLVRRTQVKRSIYRILGIGIPTTEDKGPGEGETGGECEGEGDRQDGHPKQHYNEEIFDDEDFYHQLLREVIERKTSEMTDPIELSQQWSEVQKLRKKTKKVVDTKASKGRKVRYHIHKKLLNFMAPFSPRPSSDQYKDDLYKSLFGQSSSSD